MGALEARGQTVSAVVMHPTDYWEMATETLGTSSSGGWAFDAASGPTSGPVLRLWGIPVYRDPYWPAAKVGTALVGAFAEVDVYFGDEYRIDVSSEAGNRFDQNITGFSGLKRRWRSTPTLRLHREAPAGHRPVRQPTPERRRFLSPSGRRRACLARAAPLGSAAGRFRRHSPVR